MLEDEVEGAIDPVQVEEGQLRSEGSAMSGNEPDMTIALGSSEKVSSSLISSTACVRSE